MASARISTHAWTVICRPLYRYIDTLPRSDCTIGFHPLTPAFYVGCRYSTMRSRSNESDSEVKCRTTGVVCKCWSWRGYRANLTNQTLYHPQEVSFTWPCAGRGRLRISDRKDQQTSEGSCNVILLYYIESRINRDEGPHFRDLLQAPPGTTRWSTTAESRNLRKLRLLRD